MARKPKASTTATTSAKVKETAKVDPAGKAQPKPEVKTESTAPRTEAVTKTNPKHTP